MPSHRAPLPPGLGESGARLYRSVVDDFDLGEHERAILLQAARTADLLDLLQDAIAAHGATVETAAGNPKANPAVADHMKAAALLARLISALGIPEETDE